MYANEWKGSTFKMISNTLRNNQIIDISLRESTYTMELSIKTNNLVDVDECYFTLNQREDERTIYITSSIKNKIDEYTIFELSFSFEKYRHVFSKDEIFDLNMNLKVNDDIKIKRIKGNQENMRMLAIVLSEHKKMFYPYTTKGGNLSFRLNDYYLFADFEEVNIAQKNISFSGHFIYPPMFMNNNYKVVNKKIIMTNNIDDHEIELPLEDVTREDLYDKYHGNVLLKESGFRGDFNFENHGSPERKVYYKFYFELTYEKNNLIETIRSTRMRLNQEKGYSQTKITQSNDKKIRVVAIPTKKSKFLSVQISEYNFKNEVVQELNSKWIKLRRSNILKKMYQNIFYLLGKLLPVRDNLIIFESFLGKQYSDSPRALYEYIKEHYSNYDMYWSVDREHLKYFENLDVKHVRRFSVKWLLLMTRSKYWVTNSRLPLWIPKPKGTIYIQTWHGTPLKRLAADMDEVHMPGTNTVKYKRNFTREAAKWDYLVSPNAYSTEIFKRAFQFDKTMIESGYPRNDFLINDNNDKTIENLKKVNNLPEDKKIILYAPTWRDNQFYAKGKYKFDLQFDLDRLRDELGDNYIIVLRLHYLVAENIDLTGYEGFVFDFSYHDDIRELYLIADLLITDYSSVFFDYANLKRPMLFYVYDIEDYRDNLRGFYFDFESKAPGPLVKTTEEIISEINKIDQNGFMPSEVTEAFYKKFCYLEDGCASERVVKEIFNN